MPIGSSRDHFHARRKAELMQKLLAILPRQTEGANIRHPEAGDDGRNRPGVGPANSPSIKARSAQSTNCAGVIS